MPHRVGHLFEEIATPSNIATAFRVYNHRRRAYRKVPYDPEMAKSILDGLCAIGNGEPTEWSFGPVRKKRLQEGIKERILHIPHTESAIAQTAVLNILGPILDKRTTTQSFSSRKGYGFHKCAAKQSRFLQLNYKNRALYCIQCDIHHFYQSLPKQVCYDAVARVIKDPKTLRLVKAILDADDEIPIGFPTSHVFANLVNSDLYERLIRSDKYIGKVFIYMDNITVYARYKKCLIRAKALIDEWLSERGMHIKGDWRMFDPSIQPVITCGFKLQRGKMVKLYDRIFRMAKRNFARLQRRPSTHDARAILSRYGWFKAARRHALFTRLLGTITKDNLKVLAS